MRTTPDTLPDTAAPLSTAALKREIRTLWYALETLMHDAATGDGPDDHQLARWAPGQRDMEHLIDDLKSDSRRHRRAPGAPYASDWRLTHEEDSRLMILRFVARATPGRWAPSADWTRWGAYGDAIGAVLGDRRPAPWIARVARVDAAPRFAGDGR
jgi:hypothetical protein